MDRILLSKSDPRQQVLPSEADSHVRHSDPPKAASRLPQSVPMTDLSKFADDVILHNARDDHWDDKTQRQASISCVQRSTGTYGKSGNDDMIGLSPSCALSLCSAIRRIVGSPATRSIVTLHSLLRSSGTQLRAGLTHSPRSNSLRFAQRIRRSAHGTRAKLPLDQAAAIFGTSPFHSCAGWNALAEPGPDGLNQIFHCAHYFVPILIYYTRCRREELCGLMVDDVILDNGEIPYLHIEKNERRRSLSRSGTSPCMRRCSG